MSITTQKIQVSNLKKHPENPRLIKDEKFKKLVKSLEEFPEMLEVRPIVVNNEMVVLGGNMRLEAAKSIGYTEVPVVMTDFTLEQQNEFMIKDNASFGDWDYDMLSNEWDNSALNDWGLDVWNGDYTPDFSDSAVSEADVKNAKARLEGAFNEDEMKTIECACPECGTLFNIEKP